MPYSRDAALESLIQSTLRAYRDMGLAVISGPSGAGKSHLAQWFHNKTRLNRAFVVVPAASLEPNRLESMVFGHAKGAFTGASQTNPGLLGGAADGTFCIEGIENLHVESQAKLLRLFQERRFLAVGAQSERKFDGGILLTADESPRRLLQRNLLREDFFYRIETNHVALPGMQGRCDDFATIGSGMLHRLQTNFSEERLPDERCLADLAKQLGAGRQLEGNFHGLWNLLQRAAILDTSPMQLMQQIDTQIDMANSSLPNTGNLKADLALVEKQLVQRAVMQHPRSRQAQADALGISLRSLMYKLKQFEI